MSGTSRRVAACRGVSRCLGVSRRVGASHIVTAGTKKSQWCLATVAGRGTRLWRVPESVLHLMALAGGTPAAFAGQRALRHKTAKQSFRAWFWVIVVAQTAALSAWVWYTTGDTAVR
jgi:uncharacterized membrane protein YsdA (DUF1294 family)